MRLENGNRNFLGSPVVKLCPSTVGGVGLILGGGTEILHASQKQGQKLEGKKKSKTMLLFLQFFLKIQLSFIKVCYIW